jgi:hypothetical protein
MAGRSHQRWLGTALVPTPVTLRLDSRKCLKFCREDEGVIVYDVNEADIDRTSS